ncbi:MAG: CoB--CoM heterodisulfide reductase iron-sulfur subunit A family protein [Candidatus Sumerlaeota bacterium]|nr:CoB--CoM heterodisulfide reductase iron-sulfur subunit A family protein [Candidatus Sumerlaeota bacterium]
MSEPSVFSHSDALLVIGGGIAGITAAVEAAESGCEVFLVERSPWLGGRVAQMNKYFPKLCPPACGLEINYQRIRKLGPRLRVFTDAEVESVRGEAGAFEAMIRAHPRYVNENCTACGECAEVCPLERSDAFNFGMKPTKAIHLPHPNAFPLRYAVDEAVCAENQCGKCVEACQYNAIDLNMAPKSVPLRVGAIIVATGWDPYDAARLDRLGFGCFPNVVTNMMMERLASPNGPTGGKILRPSDNQPPKRVAFVQCAGSRDENHLPYCSAICCLASFKQAAYVREQIPDSEVRIFYIDRRAHGAFEEFLAKVEADPGVTATKGKVAQVEEDAATKNLTVMAEDILGGGKLKVETDLVILATGMVPAANHLPLPLKREENGFAADPAQPAGIFVAGLSRQPADVAAAMQDATRAAMEAVGFVRG